MKADEEESQERKEVTERVTEAKELELIVCYLLSTRKFLGASTNLSNMVRTVVLSDCHYLSSELII